MESGLPGKNSLLANRLRISVLFMHNFIHTFRGAARVIPFQAKAIASNTSKRR